MTCEPFQRLLAVSDKLFKQFPHRECVLAGEAHCPRTVALPVCSPSHLWLCKVIHSYIGFCASHNCNRQRITRKFPAQSNSISDVFGGTGWVMALPPGQRTQTRSGVSGVASTGTALS